MTNIPASTSRGVKHLAPIVEARRKQLEEYDISWVDKPVGWFYFRCEDNSPPS